MIRESIRSTQSAVKGTTTTQSQNGFTLLELMITLVIISILSALALPLSRNLTRRYKEEGLRQELNIMRRAIDAFHKDWNRDDDNLIGELCKKNKISCKEITSVNGYPKTLETLLSVELTGEVEHSSRKYLRKLFVDPMTRSKEWGLRCYVDPPDTETWCGEDVYDVFTTSRETASDKSNYRDW